MYHMNLSNQEIVNPWSDIILAEVFVHRLVQEVTIESTEVMRLQSTLLDDLHDVCEGVAGIGLPHDLLAISFGSGACLQRHDVDRRIRVRGDLCDRGIVERVRLVLRFDVHGVSEESVVVAATQLPRCLFGARGEEGIGEGNQLLENCIRVAREHCPLC